MNQRDQYKEILDKLLSGDITTQERYLIEKLALDDPLLFEAIEGYVKSASPDHIQHLEDLHLRIASYQQTKKKRRFLYPVAVAASILLLVFIGNGLLNSDPEVSESGVMALNESEIPPPLQEDNSDLVTENIQSANRAENEESQNPEIENIEPTTQESVKSIDIAPSNSRSTPSIAAIEDVSKGEQTLTPYDRVTIQDQSTQSESEKKINLSERLEMNKRVADPAASPTNVPARGLTLNNLEADNIKSFTSLSQYIDSDLDRFISSAYFKEYDVYPSDANIRFNLGFDYDNALIAVNVIEGDTLIGGRIVEIIKAFDRFKMNKEYQGKSLQYIFNSSGKKD